MMLDIISSFCWLEYKLMVEAGVPFAVSSEDPYFADREGLFLLLMTVVTLSLLPILKLISLGFRNIPHPPSSFL